jgi:hypothetical protein
VGVVAARVHDSSVLRSIIRLALLLDGERVHVRPQENRLARCRSSQQADHTGSGDPCSCLDPECPEAVRYESGRLVLLVQELGMLVDCATVGDDFGR